jgi:peptidoglycan LD-endopeptidase LytH
VRFAFMKRARAWRRAARLSSIRDEEGELRINARTRRRVILLTFAGLCVLFGAIILINLAPRRAGLQAKSRPPTSQPAPPKIEPAISSDNASATPPPTLPAPAASASDKTPATDLAAATPAPGLVNDADITALKARDLLIPVAGVTANQLRDSFYDGRSEGRTHEALDIMAAGGTPVLAAADGTIVRLFHSDKGGITLYEMDASGLYVYYYAHLQRYADGISEGKRLSRGEVIAYVGDTGNAGAGNYHLHFAIAKPAAPGKWSGGNPINPYPILAGK